MSFSAPCKIAGFRFSSKVFCAKRSTFRDGPKTKRRDQVRSVAYEESAGVSVVGQQYSTGSLPPEALDAVDRPLGVTDDLRRLMNVPEDADFLGYLIYDNDSEEFLYKEVRTYDKPVRNFSRIPHQAFRFKSFAEAHQQAHKEHGESVVALFDLGAEQILICSTFRRNNRTEFRRTLS